MDKNNKSESLNGVYGTICEIIGFENTVQSDEGQSDKFSHTALF